MRRNVLPCVAITLFGVLLGAALVTGLISSQRRSAAELEAAGRAHARSLENDAPVSAAAPVAAPWSASPISARVAAAPASRPADDGAGFPWTPSILNRSLFPNGLLVNARPAHAATIATTDLSVRQRADSSPAIPTDSSYLQAKGLWKDTGHGGWEVPRAPAGAKASATGKPVNSTDGAAPPVSRRTPSLHESRRAMHPRR